MLMKRYLRVCIYLILLGSSLLWSAWAPADTLTQPLRSFPLTGYVGGVSGIEFDGSQRTIATSNDGVIWMHRSGNFNRFIPYRVFAANAGQAVVAASAL